MYIYNKKLAFALMALALIAIMTVSPLGAFAAQEPAEDQGSQKITVTQEFTYKAGEKPNIPETISQFGQILTLVSVSDPVETASLPASRTYTYRVVGTYTPEQLSQAPKNVKLSPVYGTGKRQVDRKETIKNLSNNDVEKLPKQKTYGDTSGTGPGAKTGGELALAEVKYEISGRDKDGLPNKYTAHVVYRGEETYTKLMYYTATAAYTNTEGDGGREKTYTVVATYEGWAPADDESEAGGPAGGAGDGKAPGGGEAAAGGLQEDADIPLAAGSGADGAGPGGGAGASGGESTAGSSGSGPVLGGSGFSLPFSLGTLSPIGTAMLATIVAAALTLLVLNVYNRRRLRESQ